MKEGKLSSALIKRYGIKKENAIGTVLWHSLNESGGIDVYDMKLGNTIVRNLKRSDLVEAREDKHKRDDEHGIQDEDDSKRGAI